MQFDLALNLNGFSPVVTNRMDFSEFLWFHKRLYKHLEDIKPKSNNKIIVSR